MIENSKIDAVIVCTPHPQHAEPAISAMKNRAHVLVEKPLATSLKDCDGMISAPDQEGVKLDLPFSDRGYHLPVNQSRSQEI